MPSDERTSRALALTAAPRERFRAAVAAAAEEIERYLDAHSARDGDEPAEPLAELGGFARGRVDASRFAALFDAAHTLPPETTQVMRRAALVLRAVHAAGDAPFAVDVPPGGELVSMTLPFRAPVQEFFAGAPDTTL